MWRGWCRAYQRARCCGFVFPRTLRKEPTKVKGVVPNLDWAAPSSSTPPFLVVPRAAASSSTREYRTAHVETTTSERTRHDETSSGRAVSQPARAHPHDNHDDATRAYVLSRVLSHEESNFREKSNGANLAETKYPLRPKSRVKIFPTS